MGREMRRKQAKKDGKSLEKDEIIEEHQIKRFLIITGVLVVIIILIYLLSAVFVTKEVDWFHRGNSSDETDTVSNSILASSIFKQSEEEYYVFFCDYNEKDNGITSLVASKLADSKVYKVDTGSALNANYVGTESNKNAKTLEELKVVPNTLIKISGDTITEYYEENEIIAKFN